MGVDGTIIVLHTHGCGWYYYSTAHTWLWMELVLCTQEVWMELVLHTHGVNVTSTTHEGFDSTE